MTEYEEQQKEVRDNYRAGLCLLQSLIKDGYDDSPVSEELMEWQREKLDMLWEHWIKMIEILFRKKLLICDGKKHSRNYRMPVS